MATLTTLADAYDLERVRNAPAAGVDALAQVAAYEERVRAYRTKPTGPPSARPTRSTTAPPKSSTATSTAGSA